MSVPCIELSHRRCKSHRGLHGLCAWSVAHMGCGTHGLWQAPPVPGCEGAVSLYINL
mgnify:CR=1 FL=1